MRLATLSMALLLPGLAYADGHASGDAAAGEDVFKRCASCHMVADGDNRLAGNGRSGPNLFALPGRTAGADEDFGRRYGDSLVEAGEAGLVWDEAQFVEYVADPKAFLASYLDNSRARSKMSFKLGDAEDAANVWAYIASLSPAPTN